MNRKIKFRGRLIKTDKWVYGYYTNIDDCVIVSKGCISFVDPKTVGQYIGLKDKNGKEIYEGDIVSYRMAGIAPEISPLIVEYRENATWGVIDKMGDKLMPSWQFAEVIGNIYENGDLLK